jgi:hypothetical protein
VSNWTYSGNPGHSAVDEVRFLIGDTKAKQPMLLDGEIAWCLGQYNNDPLLASIRCCEVLIANAGSLVDQSVGPASLSLSQRIRSLSEVVLPTLKQRQALEGAKPYMGGLWRSDQITNNQQGIVRALFNRNIFDPQGFRIGPLRWGNDGNIYRTW